MPQFRFFSRTLASHLKLTTSARATVVCGGGEGGGRLERGWRSVAHQENYSASKSAVYSKTRGATSKNHNLAGQTSEPRTFSLIFPCRGDSKRSEEETVKVQRAREEIVAQGEGTTGFSLTTIESFSLLSRLRAILAIDSLLLLPSPPIILPSIIIIIFLIFSPFPDNPDPGR